ncbi:MAG: LD-carboxypeptidase [Sphingomonadales bacterium]|nr:LD-carboxypeptidase [Sphingomonadales bacterium]
MKQIRRIGVIAPSTPIVREDAERLLALANDHFPQLAIGVSDACFDRDGHFAGSDRRRAENFCRAAHCGKYDALWFARGGYGAVRMAGLALQSIDRAAVRDMVFMGYSDAGNLLGGLYRLGLGHPVHGPMPADLRRDGGEAAVLRALSWFANGDRAAIEPSLAATDAPVAAFNLMTLSMMIATPLMPDLSGHVLMLEEVSEYVYAFDRAMAHVTTALQDIGLAGIRMGRFGDILPNDHPFGMEYEAIAKQWCERTGIAYLGRADIGHDGANRIVPFGRFGR